MRKLHYALLLLAPLTMVACEGAEMEDSEVAEDVPAAAEAAPAMDQAAIEEELTELRDSWVRAAEAGDGGQVASLYTEDALMVGADGEKMEGRQAIQEGLEPGFAALTALEVNSVAAEYGQDLVSDMGTYSQTFETEDGEQTVTGHYLVVIQRQDDGSWKIVHHLSAPDAPEGEAAPAQEM